ncbi:hypothetical protein LCGC14_2895620 [marine sediment metagenome]|uniref:Uncharacterized protein n=1 Tax=marine sediment metagenome TaxID=412755 RepID=A0A0F8YHP8_9ZZZZ
MTDPPFRNSEAVRKQLKELHDTVGLSWPRIAANNGFSPIPAGTLCSIYHGMPVPLKWRKRLGMSEKKKVSGCLTCGKVHTTKRCTNGNHKPRPPRIAIRLGNPESAAASIKGHMDQAAIRELRELLEEK